MAQRVTPLDGRAYAIRPRNIGADTHSGLTRDRRGYDGIVMLTGLGIHKTIVLDNAWVIKNNSWRIAGFDPNIVFERIENSDDIQAINGWELFQTPEEAVEWYAENRPETFNHYMKEVL